MAINVGLGTGIVLLLYTALMSILACTDGCWLTLCLSVNVVYYMYICLPTRHSLSVEVCVCVGLKAIVYLFEYLHVYYMKFT